MGPRSELSGLFAQALGGNGHGGHGSAPKLKPDWSSHAVAAERAQQLRTLWDQYDTFDEFKPGDLVVWRPGLKDRHLPDYGEPILVVHHMDNPVQLDDVHLMGSPFFREHLDLRAAIICPHCGEFEIHHFDSHRFMRWEPADKK